MRNISDLLPLGSIVTLDDSDQKLMIFGILQSNGLEEGDQYDYIAVPYPMGNIGVGNQYLFYHDDIDEVIHIGYEDQEYTDFITNLEELYQDPSQMY